MSLAGLHPPETVICSGPEGLAARLTRNLAKDGNESAVD